MANEERCPTGYPTNARNQIQPFFLSEDDYKSKKIVACIKVHTELLHLLNFRQPLSTKELLSEIGYSKQKLLRDLKQLQRHDLVKRVSFESHVLYVINGNFNTLIKDTLNL
jgi:transcriptional antiterminator